MYVCVCMYVPHRCERKHFSNRLSLLITTSISMIAALTALLLSTITINFNFPFEEMHACGNDRNVWLTTCQQIQLVDELPFRCCEGTPLKILFFLFNYYLTIC